MHQRCRCTLERLKAIVAGFATRNGKDGADYWLKWHQSLPNCYLTKEEAKALGWKAILGNLTDVAPGKMIGGDIYQNRNGHLPQAPGQFGTKQILTLPMDIAQGIVFSTPMMA